MIVPSDSSEAIVGSDEAKVQTRSSPWLPQEAVAHRGSASVVRLGLFSVLVEKLRLFGLLANP